MKSDERIYLAWKDEDADAMYGATVVDTANGSLGVDIVDAGGSTVGSPLPMTMSSAIFSFAHHYGAFWNEFRANSVTNGTGGVGLDLSLAPDLGATALWDGTVDYDFNDPTADAGDGGDADSVGGQMTVTQGSRR